MASAYGDNRGCSRNFANDNGKEIIVNLMR